MSLPLFPLHTVLLPGCTLDLQLFEPRYLDMLSRCLKSGQGFGVVTLFEGSEVGEVAGAFSEVGCEALIRDWHTQDNGLLGVRVEGARRFRVRQAEAQADRLTVAEVDWLPEPQDLPLTDAEGDLLELLAVLGRHPLVQSLDMSGPVERQGALACRLGYLLPLTAEQKLALLQEDDPAERLQSLQDFLERLQDEQQA